MQDVTRRNHQLRRTLAVPRLLAQEALTLAQIAARLGVSQRTVRRDLYALMDAGLDFKVINDRETQDDEGLYYDPAERAGRTCDRVALRLDTRSWAGLLYVPAV